MDSPITSSPPQDRLDLENITPISATLETLSPPPPTGQTSSTYIPRKEPIPANRVALIRQIEEEEAIQEERCKARQIIYKIMGILGSIVLILFIGYFSMYELDLIRHKNPNEFPIINVEQQLQANKTIIIKKEPSSNLLLQRKSSILTSPIVVVDQK